MKNDGCLYTIFSFCTAMIGYTIHHRIFWALIDFIFAPLVWVKWAICHDVTISVFKKLIPWFFM